MKQIDIIMYNTMTNKTESYFIKENGIKTKVNKQIALDTIKHYYKLANANKIKLREKYYFNGNKHLVIKELYITNMED